MSLTSKERAKLKSMAMEMSPIQYFGKASLTEENLRNVDEALTARELIKIKVLLETSPEKPKVIAQKLAEATSSDCVGVIGGSMIFYRYNPELHKEEKKKQK